MSPQRVTLDTITELIQNGDFDEALSALDTLDQDSLTENDQPRVLALYIHCLRCVGEDEAAEQMLSETESLMAEIPTAPLTAGEALLGLEEYEDAEWLFERYCLSSPKDNEGWLHLGFAREALEDFEQALTAYSTAIELNAASPDGYRGKASTLSALGRASEAADFYQRYLAMFPCDPDAWISLGNIRTDLEDFDGAYAAFQSADQLEEDPLRLHMMWALSALACRDQKQIKASLAKMKAADPKDWRTISVDAMLAETSGAIAKGWKCYRRAFELTCRDFPYGAIETSAELMLLFAVRHQLTAEYDEVLPQLFEIRPFSEHVLGAMRILSGAHADTAGDYMVVLEGSIDEEDIDDAPDESADYGPPYRFLRMVRVLATSEEEAVRMATDFETQCRAKRLIVHEVKRAPWKGGGHLGVWLRPPAEVFSENGPDSIHDN